MPSTERISPTFSWTSASRRLRVSFCSSPPRAPGTSDQTWRTPAESQSWRFRNLNGQSSSTKWWLIDIDWIMINFKKLNYDKESDKMCMFLIFRGKQTRQIFRQSNLFLCLMSPIWRQALVTAPLVATPSLDHGLELLSCDVTVQCAVCVLMCRVW